MTKRDSQKKLEFQRETLRPLSPEDAKRIKGGDKPTVSSAGCQPSLGTSSGC
jgi:hypothetical protein